MSYCSSNIADRPSLTKKCKESLWDQTSNIIAINNKYFVKHDTKFEAWRWDNDSTRKKNIVFNEMRNNKGECVRCTCKDVLCNWMSDMEMYEALFSLENDITERRYRYRRRDVVNN